MWNLKKGKRKELEKRTKEQKQSLFAPHRAGAPATTLSQRGQQGGPHLKETLSAHSLSLGLPALPRIPPPPHTHTYSRPGLSLLARAFPTLHLERAWGERGLLQWVQGDDPDQGLPERSNAPRQALSILTSPTFASIHPILDKVGNRPKRWERSGPGVFSRSVGEAGNGPMHPRRDLVLVTFSTPGDSWPPIPANLPQSSPCLESLNPQGSRSQEP